jgi:hypothetical protein
MTDSVALFYLQIVATPRKAEVGELYPVPAVQQDVLAFEISVSYSV